MLDHSLTGFKIPTDPTRLEQLPKSCFGSYSLSTCVALLFETKDVPVYFEECEFGWLRELDSWAHKQRLQVLCLPLQTVVRGFHLRFLKNEAFSLQLEDGTRSSRVEALLFLGESLQANPSGLEGETFDDCRIIFVPYDPVPTTVKFSQ